MTDDTMPLLDALLKRGGGDFMKDLAEEVLGRLMAYDVEGQIGAGRYERSEERTTQRNGYRHRAFDTRLGTLDLKIPKLRKGSYFPGFLEPRRTTEQALVAVIQEAWIQGVSTRKVDDLVQAMGMSGISKSQVSELCKGIDVRVNSFLERPIEGEWTYLWLDATYLKVRENGFSGTFRAVWRHAVCRTRARRSRKPARPYMDRLMAFTRLICPSAGLVVQGVSRAACTAARSRPSPAAKSASGVPMASVRTRSRLSSPSRRSRRPKRFAIAAASPSTGACASSRARKA